MCIRCEKDGLVLKYPIGMTRNELATELKYSRSTIKNWMRVHPLEPISARTINRRPQYLYSAYEVACWLNHIVFKELLDKMEKTDKFRRDLANLKKLYKKLERKGGPEFEKVKLQLEKIQAGIDERRAIAEAQKMEYLAKRAEKEVEKGNDQR